MIITHTKEEIIRYSYLNRFPDQFVDDSKKETNESWIKDTMDYFANVSYSQFRRHRDTFVPNYDLMKGIITYNDFYQKDPQVKSFVEMLDADTELPSYVKHYSILNSPVNTMVGEQSKRPDNRRVRAFDDESRSEELESKTDILQQLIQQDAKERIYMKLAQEGVDIEHITKEEEDQAEKLTMDSVKDYMTDYTSMAERWGNHMMTALKAEFDMKEKGEDAFRDLLICGREFYHIYEDNSKLGFGITVANPKNVWFLTTPDQKYTKKAYAIGTVEVMEVSEIIETFPDVTKEEIDHLRQSLQDFGLINVRESNLFNNREVGINSIKYDTYDPLVLQERMMVEASLKENRDELRDWLGLSSNVASFGYKYAVVRAYWLSKKRVGQLVYMDDQGNEQVTLVDESYTEGGPGEISITWGWINQWWQGVKIGPDVYHIKPLKLLDYAPIIGVSYEQKNTEVKSLVDMMKPFQIIYNICMNQLFRLLEKEIGKVYLTSIRHIPVPKDGDAQDALEIWEEEARKRGVVFIDDSPENLKAPSSFNQHREIDLTRTQEIQSRYTIAQSIKNECWELVGMNRQRLGSPLATETATANQNALVQSFAQTEPYFVQHEYVLNQVYQAILDAAQYVESNKPFSTINYIANEGEAGFIKVQGSDIKLRDLHVFATNNPEDVKLFTEIRALAQPMLQNGASESDIINMYSTNSMRMMKKIAKDLEEKKDSMIAQNQQLEQQKVQGEQQAKQAELQLQEKIHDENLEMQKYKIDVDANTRLAVAEIMDYIKDPTVDQNNNGTPDYMEVANLSLKQMEGIRRADLETRKLNLATQKLAAESKNKKADLAMQEKKLALEKERNQIMKNKPKPKPKAK